jgi:hypothetical protein
LLYGSFQLSSSVFFRALSIYSISKIPSISQNTVAISLPFLAVDPLHGFLFCRWFPVIHPRFITCYNFLKKLFVVRQSSQIFFANVQTQFLFGIKQFRNPTCAETLFIPKSSCNIFKTIASNITTSSAVSETLILRSAKAKTSTFLMFSLVLGFIFFPGQEFDYASML